jgi:hypothetical protein
LSGKDILSLNFEEGIVEKIRYTNKQIKYTIDCTTQHPICDYRISRCVSYYQDAFYNLFKVKILFGGISK